MIGAMRQVYPSLTSLWRQVLMSFLKGSCGVRLTTARAARAKQSRESDGVPTATHCHPTAAADCSFQLALLPTTHGTLNSIVKLSLSNATT